MNRIFPRIQHALPVSTKSTLVSRDDARRSARERRAKTEAILRDVAYVLSLTRRVKEAIVEEREVETLTTV